MKKLTILLIILAGTLTSFAQDAKSTVPNKADSTVKTLYTCPMHPDVASDKPGNCPKCGMALVTKKVKADKQYYTCSMHLDIISDKPGKCPKCGMEMVKKKETGNSKMKG